MLKICEFGVLLFDCFVYRQNVTCLKRFTRYGHYAGEVEDIIGPQTRSCLLNRCAKNYTVWLRFDDAMLKVVGFISCGNSVVMTRWYLS